MNDEEIYDDAQTEIDCLKSEIQSYQRIIKELKETQQKQLSDKEINALAEKYYPMANCHNYSMELAYGDLQTGFITGYKVAQELKQL